MKQYPVLDTAFQCFKRNILKVLDELNNIATKDTDLLVSKVFFL